MNKFLESLRPEELVTLKLRQLYEQLGYRKYRMARFEEYSLYAMNRNFLTGDRMITFTDLDGKLLALKPDVTLSILKNTKADRYSKEKLYYMENVYRESKESHTYQEISQMGLEYLGNIDEQGVLEVLSLAEQSLAAIQRPFALSVSHMGFVVGLLNCLPVNEEKKAVLLKSIRTRNLPELQRELGNCKLHQELEVALSRIPLLYGDFPEVLRAAAEIICNEEMKQAFEQLQSLYRMMEQRGLHKKLILDFSMVNDTDYYNGIVFRGYVEGLPRSVLAGGQYDHMAKKLGKQADAIGFALYLNELSRLPQSKDFGGESAIQPCEEMEKRQWLTIALPKGRLGDQVYRLLERVGYACSEIYEDNRKLVFENPAACIRYLLVKPSDVAIYVEHHAADVGIVGKDILLESKPDVYELLDLKLGTCRMAVAAREGYVEDVDRTLRVATKFVNIAKEYYGSINRDIDIIKLNGSIELAPILGLSDVIVDIVESGNTIRENKLQVVEEFLQISARFIANKSSFTFKNQRIEEMVTKLRLAVSIEEREDRE